ncbi:sce7726 family protein [Chitinophaga agri]|uniref:Sce7726 family protein n=1 Tax=Chitinophaga agri TaxID=2703787 RepID=A0A6B9ZLI2_9BACT|nr:sce7726 family protein [Chitinophaga agri]QHS63248.1 sce7726 family protein [Chitinophaga agri]
MVKHIEVKYPSLLANLFSPSFTQKMIKGTHVPYLTHVLNQTGFKSLLRSGLTVKSVLPKIFYYLNDHYRCEYIYKSAILNEVLLKNYTLQEASYFTEFRSFNAKADIVILNGTSIVYEVKSDIDRLDRLISQTSAYQKIFDKVIITSNKENITKIEKIVAPNIGITMLNTDLTVDTFREAKSNLDILDKDLIFDSLRRSEYLSIIEKAFGQTPKVPGTIIHATCKKIFQQLSNIEAHSYFINTLKQRRISRDQINLVNNAHKALKNLLIEKKLSDNDCKLVKLGLEQKIN